MVIISRLNYLVQRRQECFPLALKVEYSHKEYILVQTKQLININNNLEMIEDYLDQIILIRLIALCIQLCTYDQTQDHDRKRWPSPPRPACQHIIQSHRNSTVQIAVCNVQLCIRSCCN